jgi:hypothetical protein
MSVITRYSQVRLEKKLSEAVKRTTDGLVKKDYERAAHEVSTIIHNRIANSGRGGDHNPEFANIESRVFEAHSGRYNILLGWLNPPGSAHEKGSGGKLWYQYQDSGFHMFGGPNWIEGIHANIDRREMLLDRLTTINRHYVGDIAKILNR